MRTSVPNVYAVGDIAGQPMLAHKGSREGLVAAAVIAGKKEAYDARCVPAVIFTSPEMASVGLTEEQCKEKGIACKTGSFPFAASGRAMSLMETDGFVKVVADAKTDEVLGVHMVGPEVTELIAEAALAIDAHLPEASLSSSARARSSSFPPARTPVHLGNRCWIRSQPVILRPGERARARAIGSPPPRSSDSICS
jgi:dihydrolipoamide dehydrogenase